MPGLGQHRTGDVLVGLGVVDHEVHPLLDHLGQVIERDVGAGLGVVESPVRIFLDNDRLTLVRIGGSLLPGGAAPLVLGVTVLTSSNDSTLAEIGCELDVVAQVERLARLAVKAGLRGLVCSPLEIVALRKILPAPVQLVTPGIRTGAEKADDQKRTLSPREAIAAGANWLVIGRPIYAAENPRAAAEKILESLN